MYTKGAEVQGPCSLLHAIVCSIAKFIKKEKEPKVRVSFYQDCEGFCSFQLVPYLEYSPNTLRHGLQKGLKKNQKKKITNLDELLHLLACGILYH